MSGTHRLWTAAALALLLAGCSETRFADMMGSGKNIPDETQVRTTQTLSMPPDLELRAPSGTVVEDGEANTAANRAKVTPQPVESAALETPSGPEPVEGAAVGPAPSPEPVDGAAVGPVPTQPKPAPATVADTATTDPNDPYAKYNISKTRADGTPKTERERYEELRQAILAEKRRKNPNYGTVWNMGDVFRDE